ncbi:MAG TPA: HAD-IB family phosphatase [Chitinophagaceae bacterium]|nr:HAD-IB family phosphatase [Chitinophagaceae bacterium]
MITVIIPALNEANTIRRVIRQVKKNENVSEIIVVDDQSMDGTVSVAHEEDVRVVTSTSIGKGHSMREGMMLAKNEILVFLDADIPNYNKDIIALLAEPLINNEADFVKSYFDRQAGRVTEILVKPLLEFFFPHLTAFKQPLSGMIAGLKSFFNKVEFENDYGVDIGLLIDMHNVKARIREVCIGEIENDMQPLQALSRMAKQVANAIIKRINIFTYMYTQKEEDEPVAARMSQLEFALREKIRCPDKLIVFDMDNTLLRGSFIKTAAEKFGFTGKLRKIYEKELSSMQRTKEIAKLLAGKSFAELINVAESIPLIGDAMQVIQKLKLHGYVCGIISDSYHTITNHIANLLGLDFSLANELEFDKSIATGNVHIPHHFMESPAGKCTHEYCKANMFSHIAKSFHIHPLYTVAVGDGENDICMLQSASTAISFNAVSPMVNAAADYCFSGDSLMPVLSAVMTKDTMQQEA